MEFLFKLLISSWNLHNVKFLYSNFFVVSYHIQICSVPCFGLPASCTNSINFNPQLWKLYRSLSKLFCKLIWIQFVLLSKLFSENMQLLKFIAPVVGISKKMLQMLFVEKSSKHFFIESYRSSRNVIPWAADVQSLCLTFH